jgi:hypothetical protein
MSLIDKLPMAYFLRSGAILFGIFHLGLPLALDFILSALLALLVPSILASFVTSLSLLVGTFAVSSIFENESVFYRPHEKFVTSFDRYQPNVNVVHEMPYGDLAAMTVNLKDPGYAAMREPRVIAFRTDRYGFRNNEDVIDADYVLVGDSFVVGNGTTQEKTISSSLSAISDRKIANLGYPSGPKNYEKRIKMHFHKYSRDGRVIVFYFEGNDFSLDEVHSPDVLSLNWKSYIISLIGHLEGQKSQYLTKVIPISDQFIRSIRRKSHSFYPWIYRALFRSTSRDSNFRPVQVTPQVRLIRLSGKTVGFYESYVKVTQSSQVSTYVFTDKEVLGLIDAIVFIPTKYRVYKKVEEKLGNPALRELKEGYEKHCIPVIDLTSVLTMEAKHRFGSGAFAFWRDDTHWNESGISIAAKHINEQVIGNKVSTKCDRLKSR